MGELHAKLCPQRNVWPKIIYCCSKGTTLFTTMFIMIIVVFSLKSMCIPCFVSISRCVSELHGIHVPIIMYGLRPTYLYDQNLRLLSLHQVSMRSTSGF